MLEPPCHRSAQPQRDLRGHGIAVRDPAVAVGAVLSSRAFVTLSAGDLFGRDGRTGTWARRKLRSPRAAPMACATATASRIWATSCTRTAAAPPSTQAVTAAAVPN